MSAYIHHAAYFTAELDWYVRFFDHAFGMTVEKSRTGSGGLREVWLAGGIQLVEVPSDTPANGKAAHLCLLVEDLENAREKALAMGCLPMSKRHWVQLPDGLCLELFEAADGAIEALAAVPKQK